MKATHFGIPGSARLRSALSPAEDNSASFDMQHWARPEDTLSERNLMWAQYEVFVDLYKYYIDIAWKASVWYYAVTGGALTYYLSHVHDQLPGPLPLVLLFLAAVSCGFAALYAKSARNLVSLRDVLEQIALELKLPGRPHVEFGTFFVLLNAVLMVAVAIAVMALFLVNVDQISLR